MNYWYKVMMRLSDELKTSFELYTRAVYNITNKNKKELFENWNGYDYYDNEFIKANKKLNYNHTNYPTIDHKISLYHGFENKISPAILGSIDNLCITKKCINSSKGRNINI